MKFYNLKDEDEITLTGEQLREWKEFIIKDFLDFKEFPDSNISGRMIINPYWLEHLLNLFFQGYLGEVWEEIMDTEMNHCALIENLGYGIIGQEFNKKHLDLSNLSPPVQTSNSTSLTSAKQKGFNMGLKASAQEPTPKLSPTEITSPNPNIKLNLAFCLPTL